MRRLRPRGVADLRGAAPEPLELAYPPDALLVVAGLPGAGKTMLLERLFPAGEALDSERLHRRWERRVAMRGRRRVYRPLVHAEHHLRIQARLRGRGPVVVHENATRRPVRRLLALTARRRGRPAHVLVLEVDPEVAAAGREARGRTGSRANLARHDRRLARLGGDGWLRAGYASCVRVDRAGAAAIARIAFDG